MESTVVTLEHGMRRFERQPRESGDLLEPLRERVEESTDRLREEQAPVQRAQLRRVKSYRALDPSLNPSNEKATPPWATLLPIPAVDP
jgi:hypothetical protein